MRWRVPAAERRPDPAPLDTDDRAAMAAGTVLWAVLAVAALVEHARLAAAGRGWWLAAALAGIALGGVGLLHTHRRAVRRAAVAGAADARTAPPRS